ncbi:MAG: hypothetical protein KKG76_05050 [Euryarchaeota archaeon]|nr:hypothetical protein [Euryarchaeota archaeon]
MLLFPEDLRETICEGLNCPSKSVTRTQGFCIQKKQDRYVQIDSDAPSVVILFRDPTIELDRDVKYVLDVKDPKKQVSSKLFDIFNKCILEMLPEDEIVYLDNFIRCKLPFSNKIITEDCLKIDPYANCCNQISLSIFNNLSNIKCLIISGTCPLVWFECKKILHYESADVEKYFKGFFDREVKTENIKNKINSVTMLGEQFLVDGWNFPVFFFPHPVTLQRQYDKYYAPGEDYHTQFINGRNKIIQILK